jgi:hypothetical protein
VEFYVGDAGFLCTSICCSAYSHAHSNKNQASSVKMSILDQSCHDV